MYDPVATARGSDTRFILAGTAGSLSRTLISVFANFRPFGFRDTPALPSQLCHPLARTEDTSDETWHAHLHIQLVPVQRRAPRHHSNRGNLLRLCAVQALDKRAGHDEDDAVTKLDDQTVVRLVIIGGDGARLRGLRQYASLDSAIVVFVEGRFIHESSKSV